MPSRIAPRGSSLSEVNYSRVSFVSLDTESAFAKPFGIIRTRSPMPSPGHSLASSSIYFTSDAKALIVNSAYGVLGFDLTARRKLDISDHFRKMKTGAIALQSTEQAVVVEEDKEKQSRSLILGLKTARFFPVLNSPRSAFISLAICGTSFSIASNPALPALPPSI